MDIPKLVIPASMSAAEIIEGIVKYLDAQGHQFDEVINDTSADPGAAPVKRMAVWAMRDRIARGEWLPNSAGPKAPSE